MSANPDHKRRDFLKTAAAGAMGIAAVKFDKVFASQSAWTSGKQINPAIDNKRVVCCYDPKMLKSVPTSYSMTGQNSTVDAARIAANMDDMAMKLAQKTTAAEAWSTIFQKPAAKTWASIKAAIKVNAIIPSNGNHPRVAIVKKICDVLVDQLGVLPANITLYDATDDASLCYTSFVSLTDKTQIRANVSKKASLLGNMTPVTIAKASKDISCVADLVNGNIDILVNISVCKVHDGPGGGYGYGSCSLCMKNHLGTFNNANGAGGATGLHSVDAICEINQHDAVIGGTPTRQQLCIVDSLLANGKTPGGSPDTRVDRLVMGAFAPIVDYLTAMKILKDVMSKTDKNNNLPKFVTNFGYTEAEVMDGWVEYTGGTGTNAPPSREYSGRIMQLSLVNPSFKRAAARFTIPHTEGVMRLRIVDGKGRSIKNLSASLDENKIVWDGKNNGGTPVSAGTYFVKIIAGTIHRSTTITVAR
jgi:hypothetical protein